jgi:hypothetical protein
MARVEAAGAAEAQAFAITRLHNTRGPAGETEIVLDRTLDRVRLREFGRLVPRALREFDKPYDLDFPLLRCTPAPPYSTFEHVHAALRDHYGEDDIYDVSTPEGREAGIHRLTIDLSASFGLHRKIRLYYNDRGYCHVVPLDIPPILKTEPLSRRAAASARAVYDALARDGLPDNDDAKARLRLFCESLSLAEDFLARHGDILHAPIDALDLNDAALILGPRVLTADRREFVAQLRRELPSPADARRDTSPFLAHAKNCGLITAMRERMVGDWPEMDALAAFVAAIDTLGDWVGADDPNQYRLNWPHSAAAVAKEPYLRLHVGPTMADIVEIVRTLLGRREGDREHTHREVTRLLDRLIDAGAVVPTTATYNGRIHRIYRKGEGSPRDLISGRIQNAFYEYYLETERELVPTLMTKVLTVLSYSAEEEAQPGVRPTPEVRGNVVSYQTDLLDDGAEVFYYLLQTGLVTRK